MPLDVIQRRYDFHEQRREILSDSLRLTVNSSSHSIIVINRATVIRYLQRSRFLDGQSLIAYVRHTLHRPGIQWVVCRENLTNLTGATGELLSLAGADFSHTDLSGAILGGDLANTKFDHSYLEGAELSMVTSMRGASFRHTHCQYLQAAGVNFEGADLLQANFSYAILNEAQLTGCRNTLAATWAGAALDGVVCEDVNLAAAVRGQLAELKDQVRAQRQEFQNFENTVIERLGGLRELQRAIETRMTEVVDPAIRQLHTQVQQLLEQQQNRLVFEHDCQEEIRRHPREFRRNASF